MNFLNYSSLQNIVCLDIKNATSKDLDIWCLLNKISEITKSYIEQIIKDNNNALYESAKIEKLYLHHDFVFAKEFENYTMNLEICDLFIDELKVIPIIENETGKKAVTRFMDNFMKNSRWEMSETFFMNLLEYQDYKKESEILFLNKTIAFDISNYDLRLFDVLYSKRYKPVHNELRNLYPNININSNFIVQKMYYYNKVPIAFSAKLLGTEHEEQWFWSDHFVDSLLYLVPTPLVVPECDLNVDAILEKINTYGLPYLTQNEINFLEKNK